MEYRLFPNAAAQFRCSMLSNSAYQIEITSDSLVIGEWNALVELGIKTPNSPHTVTSWHPLQWAMGWVGSDLSLYMLVFLT